MGWWMTYVSVYLISPLYDKLYESSMNLGAIRMVMKSEELIRLWKETRDSWIREIVKISNVGKRSMSQGAIRKIMFLTMYVYEKCFMLQVSTAGQTWYPIGSQLKRQILSVHVYDKIPLWMVYVKWVSYESETRSLCVAR
jgi:hypothetical protein